MDHELYKLAVIVAVIMWNVLLSKMWSNANTNWSLKCKWLNYKITFHKFTAIQTCFTHTHTQLSNVFLTLTVAWNLNTIHNAVAFSFQLAPEKKLCLIQVLFHLSSFMSLAQMFNNEPQDKSKKPMPVNGSLVNCARNIYHNIKTCIFYTLKMFFVNIISPKFYK